MNKYLAVSEAIDWTDRNIQQQSKELSLGANSQVDVAKACFLYVRDEIQHSGDYKQNPVTYKASDVLKHKTGYCYAKSHLLAALLRANNIPAGLCYQRLTIDNDQPPYCLHGLNAVLLPDLGWYRIDARGNKEGVNAQFTPPNEVLAFPIKIKGELDLPEVWSEPLSVVAAVLISSKNYLEVQNNLPDVEII
ncbi:Phosphonate ABC transporter phosphate-binding periplasmic component (TC 3.A.1.9.1) [hydrothermal vent metagenome]|uniref:Phosphonate ABC transporter phosphate-binding periplasmic component (TC 3.A.1.9.1) n=1 Tax=hydrothermal vent metagenome TaxID=652676 RepID=A0A3B0Z7T8_9ZZZZ